MRPSRSTPPTLLVALAAVLLAAASLLACATELPLPSQPGAADVYRTELASNPKGRRAREVREGLEQAEFEGARRQHTVLAYRTFLSEFPDGPRAREARSLLEGLRWAEADRAGTEQALLGFLGDEPAGSHAQAAWAHLAQLRMAAAIARGDAPAVREWLQQNPGSADRAKAESALERLEFEAAAAAPLAEREGRLQAWLRSFPGSERRAEALALLDRAALDEAVLLDDEPQLRALRRGPLGDQGREAATLVTLRRAAAQLDAQQLGELAASAGPVATAGSADAAAQAKELLKALAALKAPARAELVRAAGVLFLPGQVPSELATGVPARGRSLIEAALAVDGSKLGPLLGETGASHPFTALAALDAAMELFDTLPKDELQVRVARLRAQLTPLAQDGPRLAQLALLAEAAGEKASALALARGAVARDPRSLVALLVAAAFESGGGDATLAPSAVQALAARARAMTDQHDPARAPAPSPGMPPGDNVPALWSLCAAERAASEAVGLAALLPDAGDARAGAGKGPSVRPASGSAASDSPLAAADPGWREAIRSAREASAAVLANASRAVIEAERLSHQPGACKRERGFLREEQPRREQARREAATKLKAAGLLGEAALARAAARDPDRDVRAIAAATR